MENVINSHEDLFIWKRSRALIKEIYQLTANFPKEEMFGIIAQMRRSAISVPSNIAEGAGRKTTKEFIRFLSISSASLSELETQIIIAEDLGYTTDSGDLRRDIIRLRILIHSTIRSLERKLSDLTPK